MKRIITVAIALFSITLSNAQTPPDGLVGLEFRNWVRANFYVDIYTQLGYGDAREAMYGYIENVEDSVECVYSGYKVAVERGDGSTPSTFNAEHIVPQSFYNESEPMRGDIHILYPSYELWNNKRSNNPFREINDTDTDEWILKLSSTSTIPPADVRDNYSENYSGVAWEPRENRKGDIARAIFYFYTMYPNYDMQFVGNVETFCDWHENDPVDDRETSRHNGIVLFQDNENPYVTNEHWANMAYGCDVEVPVNTSIKLNSNEVNVFPNPATDKLNISIESWKDYPLNAEIYSLNGTLMYSFIMNNSNALIDVSSFPAAQYILALKDENQVLIGNQRILVQ